jgi:hypothetical protein
MVVVESVSSSSLSKEAQMRTTGKLLLAGIVTVVFAGSALAQASAPASVTGPGMGPASIEQPAVSKAKKTKGTKKHGKKHGKKHSRKHAKKSAAKQS